MHKLARVVMFLAVAACGGSPKPQPTPAPGPNPPVPEGSASATGSGSAAPMECTASGGQCVPTSPTACPNGTVGDVSKYSCGSGQECCLPKQ